MAQLTLRRMTFAALAYCALCGVVLSLVCESWNTIFVMGPALLIPVIGFFAIVYGIREVHTIKDLDELKDILWKRSTGDDPAEDNAASIQNGDRAVAYADRIIDRQINKARGILPFNSIIMAALSIERSRIPAPGLNDLLSWTSIVNYWIPTGCFFVIVVILGLSSWYCLLLFLVRWAPSDEYTNFRAEFYRTFDLINKRSRRIQLATVLSATSLFVGLCLVMMTGASVLNRPALSTESRAPLPAHDNPPEQGAPPAADH